MKRKLALLSLLFFVLSLMQAQECRVVNNPVAHLDGSWEVVGEPGNVVFAIVNDKLIYDNEIWSYKVVAKGKKITMEILSGSNHREIYIKDKGDGTLLLQNNKKEKGVLLTNERQHPAKSLSYCYEPQRVSPMFFTSGRAVIKGAFTNIPEALNANKIIKIISHECVTFSENNLSVNINDDGTFYAELDLPYAQYVYIIYGRELIRLFVEPNDTLTLVIDCLENFGTAKYYTRGMMAVAGNSLAAQVNRYAGIADGECTSYYNMYSAFKEMYEHASTPEKMYEYADTCAKRISGLLTSGVDVVDAYSISSRAKDILLTDILGNIFENQLSALMYYTENRFEKNEDGVIVKREDYVPIDRKRYFSILDRYSDELLNNRLFLSAAQWGLFNRAAFYLVDPTGQQKFLNKVNNYIKSDSSPNFRISLDLMLLNKYSPADRDVLCSMEYDSLFSRRMFFDMMFDETVKGLGDNAMDKFLLQASMGQYIGWNYRTVDEILESILYVLPHITDDIVRRELLCNLRKVIREREGGNGKAVPAAVSDFLKELNDKYPGEHIVLDFWGLGCGPCRSSMISQRPLVEKLRGKVRFCYICEDVTNDDEKAKTFLCENDIKGENIRVSLDTWNVLSTYFNFNGIPHVEVLSKDGDIMESEGRAIDLENLLEELLNEKIDVDY